MAHMKWKAFTGGWRIATADGVYLGKVESEEVADRIITALDMVPLVEALDRAAHDVALRPTETNMQRLRATRARVSSKLRGY